MPRFYALALVLVCVICLGCSNEESGGPTAASDVAPTVAETPTAAPSATPDDTPAANLTPMTGCGAPPTYGVSTVSLDSGGVSRSYRLYVPASYDASTPAPLVLNFHGFGSSAFRQERYAGVQAKAEETGYVVVTPEGTGVPSRWFINGSFESGYVDDVAFTSSLIADVSSRLCIDPDRVYAMGLSNGGGMAALLACELNGELAAVAMVAGSPYSGACEGKGPIPAVIFHGTADILVPFNGGLFGLAPLPVRESLRLWAEHNGCEAALQTERLAPDVVVEYYEGCEDGADTLLYVIENGGHTWPGADVPLSLLGATTQSIDATDIIWDFFQAHVNR